MPATVIDGKAIAAKIRQEIKASVETLKEKTAQVPGLAVVLIGDRKDSATYVRMKKRAAAECGIQSFEVKLPENTSQEEVQQAVRDLNSRAEVHGILVQLPLPKHLNEKAILDEISIGKDVDGLHPSNVGSLALKGREPLFTACTPRGCIELLERSGVTIAGKNAVVLGRSNIVGMPVALLLMQCNATVTVCHSRTQDVESKVRQADIVIAALGRAQMVTKEWIKPGAVVIDVGTNAVDDPSAKRGYRLVGDVDFDQVKEVASAITPVPGGVGPMTIAMLLQNTLESAQRTLLE